MDEIAFCGMLFIWKSRKGVDKYLENYEIFETKLDFPYYYVSDWCQIYNDRYPAMPFLMQSRTFFVKSDLKTLQETSR